MVPKSQIDLKINLTFPISRKKNSIHLISIDFGHYHNAIYAISVHFPDCHEALFFPPISNITQAFTV